MPSPTSTGTDAAGRDPWRGVLAMAAAAVPTAVIVLVAAVLVLEAVGFEPVWFEPPVTLSEAAALRDSGMVLRLIRSGEDPNRRTHVRIGILRSRPYEMTPLEAAVAARRRDVVSLLEANGARVDETTRARLVCFAEDMGAGDIVAYLHPGDGVVDCDGVPKVPF